MKRLQPGKMRETVTLERATLAPNAYGTEAETWAPLAVLRAEIVTEEALQEAGAPAGTRGRRKVTFRTRVFGGVTVGDRVQWRGLPFDVVQIGGGDFAEGRALELVCEGAA